MQKTREEQIAEIRQTTGIDEALIRALVFAFYERVRQDEMLAPVFNGRIKDWDTHLEKMCAFWSSVALMSGQYSGQPMQRHQALPVTGKHFDRWLSLFETTAKELCNPAAAAHYIERARRIAESLELGIAAHRGVMLKRGERLQDAGHDPRSEFTGP